MKTPQRNFIVEIKSGRRRSIAHPTSIWSGTDMKALIRAAEADAPHLFDQATVAPIASSDSAAQPERTEMTDFDTVQPVEEPYVEIEKNADLDDNPGGTVSATSGPEGRTRSQESVNVGRNRGIQTRRKGTAENPDVATSAFHVEISAEDLDALHSENLRLKGLLAQQLREQNLQLWALLRRFGLY